MATPALGSGHARLTPPTDPLSQPKNRDTLPRVLLTSQPIVTTSDKKSRRRQNSAGVAGESQSWSHPGLPLGRSLVFFRCRSAPSLCGRRVTWLWGWLRFLFGSGGILGSFLVTLICRT